MSVIINGDTGIDKITDGSVVQADLASGVSGTGPAFSAYLSANQSTGNNVSAKVQYDTVIFDTTSDYDNTTNYRYIPSVAGYYLFVATLRYNTSSSGVRRLSFFKNGAEETRVIRYDGATNGTFSASASSLIYMNGTTDYMEVYVSQDSGAPLDLLGTSFGNRFEAFLARAS